MIKIILKILEYLPPIVFLLFFSFIGFVILLDLNHVDMPFLTFILICMVLYWPITLGTLFFLAGMGVFNLFYKLSIKKDPPKRPVPVDEKSN